MMSFCCIDVAISIPFGNHDSSNMIHIYHGSKDGLVLKPSQVIRRRRRGK